MNILKTRLMRPQHNNYISNCAPSMRGLLGAALIVLASCGGGGGSTSDGVDTANPTTPAPGTTPASTGGSPTFYLKKEMTEIGVSEPNPNFIAQKILEIQILCNINNKVNAPPPDSAGLSRIGLATYEYWSLNGKLKELRSTTRLDIDKTTCAATRSTELIAWVGDGTSYNIVNYDRQTVQYEPSPAYKPSTTLPTGQDKRTIAG
jgi:hypothetical protein